MGTRMRKQDVEGWLRACVACTPGMKWVEKHGPFRNVYELWKALDRVDWLSWLASTPYTESNLGSALEKDATLLSDTVYPLWCSSTMVQNTSAANEFRRAIPWSRVRPLMKRLFDEMGFTW